MDGLFWFCRILRLREIFRDETRIATNNSNTIYNKTQEKYVETT